MRNILSTSPKNIKSELKKYFDNCDPHIMDVEVVSYKEDSAGKVKTVKTKTRQKPYTISGVANTLGVTTKQFQELADPDLPVKKGSIKLTSDVKKILIWALQQVEEYAERNLYTAGKGQGAQFVLKNIGDWKDKAEVETPGLSESILQLEKTISKSLKK
jgi:hypothetical protein